MAMDDLEAQRQIQQMVNFILNEAKDKANEIEAKALEDFNIEKLKLVQQMKDKIRQEFQKKAKSLEVQRAIAHSTAINRARLRKMAAREQILQDVVAQSGKELANIRGETKYEALMIDLIVQALLRLLESHVIVRCRECDKALCEKLLPQATKKYTEVIKKQANVQRVTHLEIDSQFLPPPPSANSAGRTCAGGVFLRTKNGKVTIDNTLDARLQIVTAECLPQIRQILFES